MAGDIDPAAHPNAVAVADAVEMFGHSNILW
jgi:hypothetical protein